MQGDTSESSSAWGVHSSALLRSVTALAGAAIAGLSSFYLLLTPVVPAAPEVSLSALTTQAAQGAVVEATLPASGGWGVAQVSATTPGAGSPPGEVSFFVPESALAAAAGSLTASGAVVTFSQAGGGYTLALPGSTPGLWPFVPGKPVWLVLLAAQGVLAGTALLVFAVVPARVVAFPRTMVRSAAEKPNVRFGDVKGADEAVAQVAEMADYLADPEKYEALGADLPRGCLLVGPPGTGKTLLAKALAGECGVDVYTANGSDFVEVFVGTGAKRVRDLYAAARASRKAVVFIDEVDAVARKRSDQSSISGAFESENTLLALLSELDGFHPGSAVITIAATNRPDVLDPALTRPGRLDRRIEVPLPDRRGREQILGVHAARVPLADSVDLAAVARNTPGFSGAQLKLTVNEAALGAARDGSSWVTQEHLAGAVALVAMGKARESALVTDADREVTAWHEAGHAVCALLLPQADDPVAVTIVPRGPAGGLTWMEGSDDQFVRLSKAKAQLTVALGGRAAELMLLDGDFTQGAAGDLQQATDLALQMTSQYGMTSLGLANRVGALARADADDVSRVVEELLAEALGAARELLEGNYELLTATVSALLEHESISGDQLRALARRD